MVLSSLLAIGTSIATSVGMSVAAAGASAAGAAVISSTTATVIGGLAVAGAVAGAASAAIGGVQGYAQGKSQQQMYEYSARTAEMNARLAREQGEREAAEQRRQNRRLYAAQINSLGSAGVISGAGQALDITSDTAFRGELDAVTAKYNRDLEAWNYDNEAMSLRYQGAVARHQGKLSLINGVIEAGASLLTSAAGWAGATGTAAKGATVTSSMSQKLFGMGLGGASKKVGIEYGSKALSSGLA